MKTKINCYGNEVFYHKKIPMLDSNHTCWAVISLDSALKKDENYYPQAFLKSKYIENKVIRHVHYNLSYFSSDDDKSDEE